MTEPTDIYKTENLLGANSKETNQEQMFREKYFLYKNKYLKLKKLLGAGDTNKKPTMSIDDWENFQADVSISQDEHYQKTNKTTPIVIQINKLYDQLVKTHCGEHKCEVTDTKKLIDEINKLIAEVNLIYPWAATNTVDELNYLTKYVHNCTCVSKFSI